MIKTEKKTTGSFYTCSPIVDYIVDWAIDNRNTVILEPSFGDGSFLYSALDRFKELGNRAPEIYGVEIQKEPFEAFTSNCSEVKCYLHDFMDFSADVNINAIIGNPPYVRLKNIDVNSREKAIDIMRKYNIEMPMNGSLWMPFVIHATELLAKDGKLGLVLPYEITYVRYAFSLWKYLKTQYSSIKIYRIYKDFFPDVDVETIIFLAEGKGGCTENIEYKTFYDFEGLFGNVNLTESTIPISDIFSLSKPFEREMLSCETKEILLRLQKNGCLRDLIEDCKFKIGYVSGNKEYFHPTADIIEKYKLAESSLLPCLINSKNISEQSEIGLDTGPAGPENYLFYPQRPSEGDMSYIAYGEKNKINTGYKCRIRTPWYIIPNIEIPDVILTVFGDIPKFIANDGRYAVSNSLLCGTIKDKSRTTAKELVCRWYNCLTLLMIELYIHSLGGGTLVLIPGEVDKIKLLCRFPTDKIEPVFSKMNDCMREKGIDAVYKLGNKLVLEDIYNFSVDEINNIKKSLEELRSWRRPEFRR